MSDNNRDIKNEPPKQDMQRSMGGSFGRHNHMMVVIKPKDFKGTLARLWQFFSRERRLLSIVLGLVILSNGIALVSPFLIGRAIDSMERGAGLVEFSLLAFTVVVLLSAYFAEGSINLLQGWLMAGVSQRIVRELRNSLFTKLQKLPISFFDTRSQGDLMSRLANDIENISSTISQSTTHLLTSSITVTGSLTMMLILSPYMTLASIVTIPLVLIVTKTIAGRTRKMFKEQQTILGKLNGNIEETISGIHVVKAFNHEEKAIKKFEELNERLSEVGIKAQIWSGFIMPVMNVINNIGFAAVAAVGGILAVNGMVTVGIIGSFLIYSRQFARPMNEIANIFNVLQSAVAGAERLFEILDQEEEAADEKDAAELKGVKGEIEFKDVNFGYRSDVPVINNINFKVPAGSSVALVGPTGAGKTTIVNLLTRFYDIGEGSITIDGIDIRDYTRRSLRGCFGIVLQDTYLFSGTIKDNISYGRLNASEEEIRQAAIMANADSFIRHLPDGYDTELSESGSNLSQGQRQLLAIARAILCDPAILILDEATSSVDTRTELHIQEAMLKLMKGKTSFIIAHRLSTIRDAHTIMVIDDGMIKECGSHDELIGAKGAYYVFLNTNI